jgi:hypothetical protein
MTATDAWAIFRENWPQIIALLIWLGVLIWALWRRKHGR